jgi:GMP synthase (glutamine-hydrolysing)
MKRLLVFQHVPYEVLGKLDPMLRSAGFRIRYVNFGRDPDTLPDVSKYDAMVVLGGPMCIGESNAYPHLNTEIQCIRDAIEQDMPILGICLGAQLIAAALGADVYSNQTKEIGWYEVTPTQEGLRDPVIKHLAGHEQVFQWHGDTFDIPPGAVHLASSPHCANQAFRFGDNIYGFQFHLEVDQAMVERWFTIPSMLEEVANTEHLASADEMLKQTGKHINASTALGEKTFGAFIELIKAGPKRKALPSR